MKVNITIPDQFVPAVEEYLQVSGQADVQSAIQEIVNGKIRNGLIQKASREARDTALEQINAIIPPASLDTPNLDIVL